MAIKTRKRLKKRPSPVIPPLEQQLLIRTSERSAFQTCLHQWQWSYLEKRKPIHDAPALSFGSLIHAALEKRYPPGIKRGPHPAKTFAKLYKEHTAKAYEFGFRDEDGEWMEAGELGVDMLEHYVEHYGKDEEWEVIASEQTFAVPVFVEDETGRVPPYYLFTYVGTMDGVWRHRLEGSVRINDYKTTAHDPVQEARNVGYNGLLSLQAGAYWTFGVDWLRSQGILKPSHLEALDGMMFSYLRKAKRETRPKNADGHYLNEPTVAALKDYAMDHQLTIPAKAKKDDLIQLIGPKRAAQLGEVSKQQPAPWFHREMVYRSEGDRERYRARAIRQVRDMIRLREGPAEDRMKHPHWLNCRNCAFRDPCELHEQNAPGWEAFLDGATEEWNPYDAHEIEMEGRR